MLRKTLYVCSTLPHLNRFMISITMQSLECQSRVWCITMTSHAVELEAGALSISWSVAAL